MRKLKGVIIALIVIGVLGVGGIAGWSYLKKNNTDPIKVYQLELVGMPEFWGDTKESSGPVTSEKIQTVYLTDTQTVTDVAVKEGQSVKKGDLLMQFDTTLSQLELERKGVEIQQTELDLEEARKELQTISWMQPMGTPPTEPEVEPNPGWALGSAYYPFFRPDHDGSSRTSAFVCWIRDDTVVGDRMLYEYLPKDLEDYLNPPEEPTEEEPTEETEEPTEEINPPTEETEDPTEETEDPTEETEASTDESTEPEEPAEPTEEIPSETQETIPETQPSESETEPIVPGTEESAPVQEGTESPAPEAMESQQITGEEALVLYADTLMEQQELVEESDTETEITETNFPEASEESAEEIEETEGQDATDGTEETEEPSEETEGDDENEEEDGKGHKKKRPHKDREEITSYYMILRITEGNTSNGETLLWLGMYVHEDGSFSFFDARGIEDYTIPPEPEPEPTTDWIGSGLTYSEIQKKKQEQMLKIQELELKLKLDETEYKLMERELSDGNIYSEVDGTVLSVLDEETAKLEKKPLIKVSGGGGFYVEASVSELDRSSIQIGQEVTVNDWENGSTYSGTVTKIGDIPVTSSESSLAWPESTAYPFTVFVAEDANLREGAHVGIRYSAASENSGVYLQMPFVRNLQDRYVVYIRGEDGLLEEREVTVGKSIWGSYLEILDGVTSEDLFAFPYGKNIRPGMPTEEGGYDDLYRY